MVVGGAVVSVGGRTVVSLMLSVRGGWVWVEGGGVGGLVAAPIAADFLKGL